MTNDEAESTARLAVMLARREPKRAEHLVSGDAMAFHRLAVGLRSLAVAACNADLTSGQEIRQDGLHRRAEDLAKSYGLTVREGDPRGYVLHLVGLPGNTWGGDESGWGVA